MKIRVLAVISSCLIVFLSSVHSEESKKLELLDFDPSPYLEAISSKVERRRLANGIRVIFYQRGDAPVFSSSIAIRAGGVDEYPGITGISHLLEHMAFKGSENVGAIDYRKEKSLMDEQDVLVGRLRKGIIGEEEITRLNAIEAELSSLSVEGFFGQEMQKRGAVGVNATTDKESTQYFQSLPSGAFEFWAYMDSERLFYPVMRQFYKELDVVLEERRMRYDDSPRGKLYEDMLAKSFTVHPYGLPVIGFVPDLNSLTATQTLEFHRNYYVPENIVVSVVGNVEPKLFWKVVDKYFGRLKTRARPARNPAPEPEQVEERKVEIEWQSQPLLYVAYKKPQWPDLDDVKIGMMLQTFAGGNQSPMYDELVRKRQIASNVTYTEAPGSAYPNLAFFIIEPRAPHTNEEALRAFDEVLEKFKVDGFSEELLLNSKRSMSVSMLSRLRSNSSLANEFAEAELLYDNWNEVINWYALAMKVTKEEVLDVAQRYFVTQRRTVGMVKTKSSPKN